MDHVKRTRMDILSLSILIIAFVSAIGSNYYHYLYLKDYDYLVTNECATNDENCISQEYYISAKNYNECFVDQNCLAECSFKGGCEISK